MSPGWDAHIRYLHHTTKPSALRTHTLHPTAVWKKVQKHSVMVFPPQAIRLVLCSFTHYLLCSYSLLLAVLLFTFVVFYFIHYRTVYWSALHSEHYCGVYTHALYVVLCSVLLVLCFMWHHGPGGPQYLFALYCTSCWLKWQWVPLWARFLWSFLHLVVSREIFPLRYHLIHEQGSIINRGSKCYAN